MQLAALQKIKQSMLACSKALTRFRQSNLKQFMGPGPALTKDFHHPLLTDSGKIPRSIAEVPIDHKHNRMFPKY